MLKQHTPSEHPRATPTTCGVCGRGAAHLVSKAGHARCHACFGRPPWDCSDRAWFSAHPRRRLRLRPPFPNETCLRDVPEARITEALECGLAVLVLVLWDGTEFTRMAGTFSGDVEPDSVYRPRHRAVDRPRACTGDGAVRLALRII